MHTPFGWLIRARAHTHTNTHTNTHTHAIMMMIVHGASCSFLVTLSFCADEKHLVYVVCRAL